MTARIIDNYHWFFSADCSPPAGPSFGWLVVAMLLGLCLIGCLALILGEFCTHGRGKQLGAKLSDEGMDAPECAGDSSFDLPIRAFRARRDWDGQ